MQCKICHNETKKLFTKRIMQKYDIEYFKCNQCDFIATEPPFWLKDAYQESINSTDTGILSRNSNFVEKLTPVYLSLFSKNAKFLDWGGGYGIFVRMMRDVGFDYYWDDPYSNNIFAKAFIKQNNQRYDAVSCFEVFEHLVNPMEEISKIFKITDTIIFSTNLSDSAKDLEGWDYLALEHGQHISFYSYRTLLTIAQKFNMTLITNKNNIHILTSKKLANKWKIKLLLSLRHRFSIVIFELSKLFIKSKTVEDSVMLK